MRGKFRIVVRHGLLVEVKGHVFGSWGVHRSGHSLVVTHIPSGRAALTCATAPQAIAVARRLHRDVPLDSLPDAPPTAYEMPLIDVKAFKAIERIVEEFNASIKAGDAW